MKSLFGAIFEPAAVALVGASGDPNKNTGRAQRYLQRHGYRGRVVPVNSSRTEVQGLPACARLDDVPDGIEHALITVPRDAVLAAVEACARRGIGVATIYSDGFADAGPAGLEHQHRLVERAKALGVRLIGPNSMGVVSTLTGLSLSVNAALEAPSLLAGGLSVVSQSGTVLGTLLSRGQARGFGFARLVSVGNEADVGVGEFVDLLVDDEHTHTIVLFLESIRDAERLATAARRALAAGKAVVAYKLGQSEAGQALARSHTGAITGGAKAASAFFRTHGIVQVQQLETLLEIGPLLAGQTPRERRSVAVVSTTGGGAGMVVDRLGSAGIHTIGAPSAVARRLEAFGLSVSDGPVVDLTMAGARADVYGAALDGLLAAPECDVVVAVVGSSAQFHADVAVRPIVELAGRAKTGAKPVAAFFAPQADESLRLLADAGVAAFRTPEACADAVQALIDWRLASCTARPAPEQVARLNAAARLLGPRRSQALNEARSLAVMSALGIEVAPYCILDYPLVQELPDRLEYPVALKVLSADIAHKSDAGGVVLNVADQSGLREAAERIMSRLRTSSPEARIEGLLAQPMCPGQAEVLLGYRLDPEVGPLITLGPGGVLAEIYDAVSVRMAPIEMVESRRMI
ncbi:MAG: acetate--CoA ligase family protein, partial [Gammaproteobacteria bacterium]